MMGKYRWWCCLDCFLRVFRGYVWAYSDTPKSTCGILFLTIENDYSKDLRIINFSITRFQNKTSTQ